MRSCAQEQRRSVDRGTCGPGIQPRKFLPPGRRRCKEKRRQRPLGVTALEDEIVQRAAVEVLNAIYETDFLGFSYRFRPGRNQHQALDALYTGLLTRKVNWVLDLDSVVRLIQKWLKAGVLEDGKRILEEGMPQGGSASPLLANVYLH
jgi:RNA-directed DNA polymerase